MNKPILALFSLLFVASAFCIDISSDEEFAPASGSNNVPKATPASAFRPTRPNSIKENDARGVHNARKLEIVDDDEDFLDNLYDDEEFIVKPSASITIKPPASKPIGAFKPTSGTKVGKRDNYDSPTATQSTKRTENVSFNKTIRQGLVDDEDMFDGDIEKSSSNYVENLVQKQPKGSSSKKKQSSSISLASSEKIKINDKSGFSQGVSQRTSSTAGGYRTTSTKTLLDDDDEDMFDGDGNILGNEEED